MPKGDIIKIDIVPVIKPKLDVEAVEAVSDQIAALTKRHLADLNGYGVRGSENMVAEFHLALVRATFDTPLTGTLEETNETAIEFTEDDVEDDIDVYVWCACGQVRMLGEDRVQVGGVSHGETPCFYCDTYGKPEVRLFDPGPADGPYNPGLYVPPPYVDMALLRTTDDAAVWAREFRKVQPDVDEGLMIGWFANAIEGAIGRAQGETSDEPDGPFRAEHPSDYPGIGSYLHDSLRRLSDEYGHRTITEAIPHVWHQG